MASMMNLLSMTMKKNQDLMTNNISKPIVRPIEKKMEKESQMESRSFEDAMKQVADAVKEPEKVKEKAKIKAENKEVKDQDTEPVKKALKNVKDKVDKIKNNPKKASEKGEKALEMGLSWQFMLQEITSLSDSVKSQMNTGAQKSTGVKTLANSNSFESSLKSLQQLIARLSRKLKQDQSQKSVSGEIAKGALKNEVGMAFENLKQGLGELKGTMENLVGQLDSTNTGSSKKGSKASPIAEVLGRKMVEVNIDPSVTKKVDSMKNQQVNQNTLNKDGNVEALGAKSGEMVEASKGKEQKGSGERSSHKDGNSQPGIKKNFSEILNQQSGESINSTEIKDASSISKMTRPQRAALGKQIVNQIGEKVRGFIGKNMSHITMDLKPEALGRVKIIMDMKNDKISGKIIVESAQVKELLEEQLQTVKSVLSESGVKLSGLEVSTEGGKSQQEQQKENSFLEQAARSRKVNQVLNSEENGTYDKGVMEHSWNTGGVSFTA